MQRHYKIDRNNRRGYDRKLIEKLNEDKKKKQQRLVIDIAFVGTIVVLGSALIINNQSKKLTSVPIHEDHSRYHLTHVEDTNIAKRNMVDFENYDLTTIEKFKDNVGSLYYADDAIKYREKYQDIVDAKAQKWGLDSNLVMAILTQESRSDDTTNLMQIGFNVWQGEPFRVYDFDNGKYVDILLTNDPVLYQSDKYLTVSSKDLQNPTTNISIGCAMLQYSMYNMKYNVPAGCQCYNYGPTSMNNKVFDETFKATYQTRDAILEDQYNFIFMNYTHAYDKGDNDYFYNMSRFLDPSKGTITIKEKNTEDTVKDHTFNYFKLLYDYNEYQEQYKDTVL